MIWKEETFRRGPWCESESARAISSGAKPMKAAIRALNELLVKAGGGVGIRSLLPIIMVCTTSY